MAEELHLLVIPYPAEGHITPMLHFARRLALKGLRITFVLPTTTSKAAQTQDTAGLINFEYISDGSDNGEQVYTMEAHFKRTQVTISQNLSKLIEKINESNIPAKLLVYCSTMPFCLNVAQSHGLRGVAFFSQPCAVNWIYYHMRNGSFSIPLEGTKVAIPPLPLLDVDDLPSFAPVMDENQTVQKFFLDQFTNIEKADWILFNTCDKLETELVRWMSNLWPIKTIGPTILRGNRHDQATQLDGCSEACIKWLNKREAGSVLYISFGTVAEYSEEQMKEIAQGLISSNYYFIWVVRTSERNKLAVNFMSKMSEKGLIVNWCNQLEVLVHPAVACFMTHCGWNSTIEALSIGVPMIGMPHFADQMTNAKFIADVWQVGVRARPNQQGIFTAAEIEKCIREVTDGEKQMQLKGNALKLKQQLEDAIAPRGSSHSNIEDFVSHISCI